MHSSRDMGTISYYSSEMDILLVGEGDFSFACALARAFARAPRLLATSLDSRETLKSKYEGWVVTCNVIELVARGGVVMHELDAKTMAKDPRLSGRHFDRIVFNFPHSGFVPGWGECTQALIERHKVLLEAFFANARGMVRSNGEVHVTHHVYGPYEEWRLEEVATRSGLRLKSCVDFKKHVFEGYTPRRGEGMNANGTFTLHNPATFIFSLPPPLPPACPILLPSDHNPSLTPPSQDQPPNDTYCRGDLILRLVLFGLVVMFFLDWFGKNQCA